MPLFFSPPPPPQTIFITAHRVCYLLLIKILQLYQSYVAQRCGRTTFTLNLYFLKEGKLANLTTSQSFRLTGATFIRV